MIESAAAVGAHQGHAHTPAGWRRWVLSTNHKDIGSMYITFALIMGLVGGVMSVLIRMELMVPGDQIFGGNYHLYNVVMTGHGLIMVFFLIMPALIGGFGNWFMPITVEAVSKEAFAEWVEKAKEEFAEEPAPTPVRVVTARAPSAD